MKTAIVPASAVACGWEARVQIFAIEHDLQITSPERYNKVKELMRAIERRSVLEQRIKRMGDTLSMTRELIRDLQEDLGWPKDQ